MSGQRLAVLVGIDEYPNLGPAQQLSGCVNDAELMAGVLQGSFGFAEADITLLRNTDASRDAILAALNGLVDRVDDEDVVVVHYSGHGSQMTDREGDEADKLDETIVPSDSGRGTAPNRDISDDEIYEWLTRLNARTQLVTLIFDCCHSGSVSRDVSGAKVRWLEADTRDPSELPPSPVTARASRAAGPSGWLPPGRRYTLMAGCRDEELSHEYGTPTGATHGALTWFLTQALAGAAEGATYRDVFEPAALGVTAAYPSQHPQMEGAVEREVFGVRERELRAFIAVTARAGDEITLGGGAAQGVQVGSLWGVFAGEKRVGSLRVTAVRATTATAQVVDETAPAAIAPPARAVLESPSEEAPRLRVAIPDELAELATLVGQSALLARADGDARALLLSPRATTAPDDPVPQLTSVEAPTVAVVGGDGRLLVPPLPADEDGTSRLMVKNLETVANYRRVLALENPASALRGKVDLTLLRKAADGSWIEATPEIAGGEVVYEAGEPIGLRISNHADRSVYPAVLDLGVAYAVNAAPQYFGSEELVPGNSVELFTRGEAMELTFPPEFPFGGPSDTATEGIEVVKLLASTAPSDYTGLLQAGVTRDFAKPARKDDEDWVAVTRPFRLRPPTAGVKLETGGSSVEAAGVELATQGVAGDAVAVGAGGGRTEAAGPRWAALEDVLSSQALDVQTAIAVDAAGAAPGTRGAETPAAIALRPPAPAPGEGQMVLAQDASGLTTWHFAAASRGLDDERREYRIDRAVAVAPANGDATRGVGSLIAKKLLKVLVFPLIEPAIGEVADFFAGKWEAKNRPYRLRYSTPEDFARPGGRDVQPADWTDLSGKRALLLVHGTFSRSHSGFGALPAGTFEDLYAQYDKRVIALDHYTLSHTPQQNVEWLLQQIPDGTELELDIVCHSRGGLVSRTLAERQSELSLGSRTLRVRRVIFVATPNAGTALADAKRLGDLIDRYTNLLSLVPDIGVTDVLDGIVTVAKMLAVGAMKGLDGLQSMVPDGDFQKWLNDGPAPRDTTYCALAANYEPSSPALKAFISDGVMDTVFRALGNDLVVPTDGVYEKNGAGLFPISSRHVFAKSDDVTHTKFFANRTTQEKLLTWLAES